MRVTTMIAAGAFVATLVAPGVGMADYTEKVKDAVNKEIVTFFQAENGNKLTEYGIRGLIQRVEATFEQNKVVQTPPTPPAPEGVPGVPGKPDPKPSKGEPK